MPQSTAAGRRLATLSLWLLGACLSKAFAAHTAQSNHPVASLENSVVKVFSTLRYPDPFKPWSKQAPSEATASGVVIEGNRILTNAHVVLYSSQVQVQANAAGDKVSATVVAVAQGIDLAVLQLDDPSFFATHPPLARAGKLPQIKDAVLAYGFPTGGASLSITKGIVSRIEFAMYNFPVSGLRIQIDAAINPGNSGGPAVAGDKMIGLAFSRAGGDTQNIGYIIPNEEIELFLKDIAGGKYHGKPGIYDDLQTLENPALRAYLKLDKSVEGMIVNRPYKTDSSYPLKQWDVVTRIGDVPIDNQGMVKLDGDSRVQFKYMVQRLAKNGEVPLTIVRAGSVMHVQLPVTENRTLVADLNGEYPSYFVYGPLVFSRASWQMLGAIEKQSNLMRALGLLKNPLVTEGLDQPSADREDLAVVAAPFLPDKLANGYSTALGQIMASINGVHVRSLAHLVALLRDLKDPFVIIEFDQRAGEALVFSRPDLLAATEGILTDNGIRSQGSPDMMSIWQDKAPQ